MNSLETITISPRKRRQIYVDVKENESKLQWYFSTDGDISFGVFYQVFANSFNDRSFKLELLVA